MKNIFTSNSVGSKAIRIVVGGAILCVVLLLLVILRGQDKETERDDRLYLEITDPKSYCELVWDYSVESDIVFGQAEGQNGTEELKLDIYKTQKEGPNPAIILLHGGGLTKGDKASPGLLKSLAIDYAKMGYVVVVPNYRLSNTGSSIALRNAMNDAKSAYEWVLANGVDYDINTNYVAIGGYSSGADIAINLCYSEYFPDLNRENLFCVIDISGGNLRYDMIDATVPGCVIVHGTQDTTVPYSNSQHFAEKLTKKNIDMSLNPLEGLNHELLSRYDEVRNIIAEYMYKCLTGKEVTISIKSETSPEYQKVLDRMNNGITYDVTQFDVKLDGSLDEWAGISTINLNKVKDAGTSLPTEEDFSGSVMLAWNEDTPTVLYIGARIKDDDIKDTVPSDGKWYQDDCLEIVFDTSANQEVQQLTKWVVGVGDKDLSVLANEENTEVFMVADNDEYIFEISIYIAKVPTGTYQGSVETIFSQERSVGFSISYNDGENGDRQHQIGWTSGKSSDRTTLGTLNFK